MADHDGHTINVGPVTAGITGEVDPDRLLRLYAAEVDRLRAEVLKHGDHTPACRYRRAEGDGRHCLPSCGWDTSDHDGHTATPRRAAAPAGLRAAAGTACPPAGGPPVATTGTPSTPAR